MFMSWRHGITVAWSEIERDMQHLLTEPLDLSWFRRWSDTTERFSDLVIEAMWAFRQDVTEEASKERYAYLQQELRPKMNAIDRALTSRSVSYKTNDLILARVIRGHKLELKASSIQSEDLEALERNLIQTCEQLESELSIDVGEPVSLWEAVDRLHDETDPVKKKHVWFKLQEAYFGISEQIDETMMKLVALRQAIAQSCSYPNYLEYLWAKNLRSFEVAHVKQIVDHVERAFQPLNKRKALYERNGMPVSEVHPWMKRDLEAPTTSRRFHEQDYLNVLIQSYEHLNPDYGNRVREMAKRGHLDLHARANKSNRNFATILLVPNAPLVFCNATGSIRDLRVVFHEVGHGIHYQLGGSNGYGLFPERVPGQEVMEFVAYSLQAFAIISLEDTRLLKPDELLSLKRSTGTLLLDVLGDAVGLERLQYWLYSQIPESIQAASEIDKKWLELLGKDEFNWSGVEHFRAKSWQNAHFVGRPLNNVTYIIAYISMLLLVGRFRKDRMGTLQTLDDLMRSGSSVDISEALKSFGIEFPFTLKDCEEAREVLEKEYIQGYF